MNIDDMRGQEKSVMLAGAMKGTMLPEKYLPIMSPEFKPVNLYDPANMALAWRVHLWALHMDDVTMCNVYRTYWKQERPWLYADAQHLWLDKVLELAIETELVDDA